MQPAERICARSLVPNTVSDPYSACWQKPNHLASCKRTVFASLTKHRQGVDERERAFAMTRSCTGRLRRTRWIALRSSCIEQDRCHPISNRTARSAASRLILQEGPTFALEQLGYRPTPLFPRASGRLALSDALHSDGRVDRIAVEQLVSAGMVEKNEHQISDFGTTAFRQRQASKPRLDLYCSDLS
jgi:hypothetical protein